MAIVKAVDVTTTLTPTVTVSLEGEQSPVTRALIEALKPTFLIRSEIGDYTYAPYGKAEGSWIVPIFAIGLLVLAAKGVFK